MHMLMFEANGLGNDYLWRFDQSFSRNRSYILPSVNMARDSSLFNFLIGQHLIPLFRKMLPRVHMSCDTLLCTLY